MRAGIPFKPLPDSHDISPFLSQCQVYSADEKVSREKCLDIFGGDKDCSRVPLIGVAFCEGETVVNPCSPEGKVRILKFSKLDSVKGPENRSAILALLDSLKIVREVFPISQFYYKIRLLENIDDAQAGLVLRQFNSNLGSDGPLFHSLFDGERTVSLVYRPPAPPRAVRSFTVHEKKAERRALPSVLILEDPLPRPFPF